MNIEKLPRVKLAHLPTPLMPLSNLSKNLDGPKIYVKRDDLTGLAFGGNKSRKLEYLLADAIKNKADTIVTGAGFHSNWCTQTAVASKKLGLDVYLIKKGPAAGYDGGDWDGNHLLHHLVGANIKVVRNKDFHHEMNETVKRLREQGRNPYFLPVGGSIPLGAAGYVKAVKELVSQSKQQQIKFDYLIHPTGSGGTQAGLVMGAKQYDPSLKIIGVNVGWGGEKDALSTVRDIIGDSRETLNHDIRIKDEDVRIYNEYSGEGYGYLTEKKAEAVSLLAKTEGLYIDPVYTGTAMACLIDLIREKQFKKEEKILFLHTGGSVALYPYKAPLKEYLQTGKLKTFTPPWIDKS